MGCAELQEEPLVHPTPQPPSSAHSIPSPDLLDKASKGKLYLPWAKRIRFARDTIRSTRKGYTSPSPSPLSEGNFTIECSETDNKIRRELQYKGRGRAMIGGKKRRCRGKGFPRHRAVNSNGWERPGLAYLIGRCRTLRSPMKPSSVCPIAIGPTPAGVPVKIRSPMRSV